MTEADTRANYIDPALKEASWDKSLITREYYFTDGRKLAGKKRGSRCFVDYLLHKDNHLIEQANLGTLSDLKQAFGGSPQDILDTFLALQHELQHELQHCA